MKMPVLLGEFRANGFTIKTDRDTGDIYFLNSPTVRGVIDVAMKQIFLTGKTNWSKSCYDINLDIPKTIDQKNELFEKIAEIR